MKKFYALILATLFFGVVSSCSDKEANVEQQQELTFSNIDFINAELAKYKDDSSIDFEGVKRSLISFDQTLNTAYKLKLQDEAEIGNLFVQNAINNGLNTYSAKEFKAAIEETQSRTKTQTIEDSVKILNKYVAMFINTANVDTIDEYIKNLDNFRTALKAEKAFDLTIKISLLSAAVMLKIKDKTIKYFHPKWSKQNIKQKWVRHLKCAFVTIMMGITGTFVGCFDGTVVVTILGSPRRKVGVKYGSIIGCGVGGLIRGLVNVVAKTCNSGKDPGNGIIKE